MNDTTTNTMTENTEHSTEKVKIMVILMIKNESKIIKRCIENVLSIADAISISDTGSTDDTINVLNEYLSTISIPSDIAIHQWKNFGHNRTLSFVAAQDFCKKLNWNPEYCYGFALDADMNFVMTNEFKKESLNKPGYSIIQKSNSIEHYNIRFLKLSFDWKCVGVTHEYWDGPTCERLKITTVYINNIGDGGCKSDKYVRDEQLLSNALIEEPNNARYMFYLAQTLCNLNKFQEAIEMYKRRIAAGGWYEEVWYSMYSISEIYYNLKDYVEMEYWGLKAYNYHKYRAENIYLLTRVFREISQHYKAWHYMLLGKSIKKPNESLFMEYNVYDHRFDYEKTILSYYVQPHKRDESIRECINYYNAWGNNYCYSNIPFYVSQINCDIIRDMNLEPIDDFAASSIAFLPYKNGNYLANIKYVNSDKSHSRTFMTFLDAEFNQCGLTQEMCIIMNNPQDISIENLRLYRTNNNININNNINWISHDKNSEHLIGSYNTNKNCLDGTLISSKNENIWVPYDANNFINSWHPFTVGRVEDNKLLVTHTQETPLFFKHICGSTNIVEHNGYFYCLTHITKNEQPQKHYHIAVRINMHTHCIEGYTNPFYFIKNQIECSLSLEIKNNIMYTIITQHDLNPTLVGINMSSLYFFNL